MKLKFFCKYGQTIRRRGFGDFLDRLVFCGLILDFLRVSLELFE